MKSIPYQWKTVLLALPAVLVGLQLLFWISSAASSEYMALCDFPHHYRVGRMLLDGQAPEIYDIDYPDIEPRIRMIGSGRAELDPDLSYHMPYLHPAFEALLFASVSFVRMRAAYFLWILVVNALAVFAIYRILLPNVPTVRSIPILLPSLLLAFSFIPRAALYGQDSVILLLVVCGAFSFITKGDLFSAGVVLGLGSFRFQHTLIVVALFLAWKAWKFVAGYFASGAGCALASLAVTGLKGQIEYFHLLRHASQWPLRDKMNNLRGVFAWLGISDAYAPILIILFLALAAFLGRNLSRRNQFLLAVVSLTLGTFYLFFFDLAVLFLPLIILLEDSLAEERRLRTIFVLAVLAAPVWLVLILHVNQAQAMTAVVLALFSFVIVTGRTFHADSSLRPEFR